MITAAEKREAQAYAVERLEAAGIVLTERERVNVEVADFGLSNLRETGLQLVVYVSTDRHCAKELVLYPGQACPEHRHPPFRRHAWEGGDVPLRQGLVYLYVEGEPTPDPACTPPPGAYTISHEIRLGPGEQHTIPANTLHWFRAGPEGAVVSEFSTASRDEHDVFTDPRVRRATVVSD